METAFEKTEHLLTEHLDELHRVAEALLELETIDGTQFEQLFNDEKSLEEIKEESLEQAKEKEEFNRREAEKRAAAEEADRKSAEEELRRHMEKGKRIAVLESDGSMVFKDLSEHRAGLSEEAQAGGDSPKQENKDES